MHFLLTDLLSYLLMPSDKHNSRTARARDLISSLINIASSRDVPFHQLQLLQCSGGVFGVWRFPPPLHNTLEKQKEWCIAIKPHKNVLFLKLNVILAVLKESIQCFLKGCIHHTPYTLFVKTTLITKIFSICKHWK